MRIVRIALTALVLSAIAGAAIPAMAADDSVTVPLKAENNSDENGTATLTQQGDDVKVVVSIKNAPSAAQPAHIHDGPCPKVGKVDYPLTNVTDGSSTTVVKGVKLADLMSGTYAINVHKSTDDLATYVSCGDLKAAPASSM